MLFPMGLFAFIAEKKRANSRPLSFINEATVQPAAFFSHGDWRRLCVHELLAGDKKKPDTQVIYTPPAQVPQSLPEH